MTKTLKIAAIPGDGIGKEVMPEGQRVLHAAARRFDIDLKFTPIEWASCDWYAKTGQMMPDDWKARLEGMDAIYFGAAGWPDTVPDHVSLWGSLIKFRREFDQYINLRPARLFEGVPCPLAGRKPGDIDMLIVRENTEGEYSAVGGVMYAGTQREFVSQTSIFSRIGSERLLKYAFELARTRQRKHVTLATKKRHLDLHALVGRALRRDGGPLPRHRLGQAAHRHPGRALRAAAAAFRRGGRDQPVRRHPERSRPGLHRHDRYRAFRQPEPRAQVPQPVRAGTRFGAGHLWPEHRQPGGHDLVGRNDARFPGPPRRARLQAIEKVLVEGPRTRDLGGTASTTEMGEAIAKLI